MLGIGCRGTRPLFCSLSTSACSHLSGAHNRFAFVVLHPNLFASVLPYSGRFIIKTMLSKKAQEHSVSLEKAEKDLQLSPGALEFFPIIRLGTTGLPSLRKRGRLRFDRTCIYSQIIKLHIHRGTNLVHGVCRGRGASITSGILRRTCQECDICRRRGGHI